MRLHVEGEHRRYCPSDLAKLTMMRRLIVAGVAPCEAAEQAREFKGKVKLSKIVQYISCYILAEKKKSTIVIIQHLRRAMKAK